MPKLSAGIMLHRSRDKGVEVLLVHPGGPFWVSKDVGVWSVPKGEYADGDDASDAARREFKEETGFDLPTGKWVELGQVKYNNKIVSVWAVGGSIDARRVHSNMFTLEWPPKTGKRQEFPEVDRAGWFPLAAARQKLVKGQVELVDRLCEQFDVSAEDSERPTQMTLL